MLVVEDEETVRDLVVAVLQREIFHKDAGASKVVYHAKPGAAGRDLVVCDPKEFLVRVLVHIPGRWEVRIRYYGAASSTARRGAATPHAAAGSAPETTTSTFVKVRRRTWAQLIRRVYGADPLACKHCGGRMRIISFSSDPEVIEKILRHIGRWRPSRGPPATPPSPGEYRVLYDESPPGDAFLPDDLPPPDPCDRPWSPQA